MRIPHAAGEKYGAMVFAVAAAVFAKNVGEYTKDAEAEND